MRSKLAAHSVYRYTDFFNVPLRPYRKNLSGDSRHKFYCVCGLDKLCFEGRRFHETSRTDAPFLFSLSCCFVEEFRVDSRVNVTSETRGVS